MTEEQAQGQPTPETEAETTTPPEPAKPEPRYTDKDVDKLKGAARKEGKHTAINELLGELEVESVDDIKELVQAFKTVEEETATETDKERKAREKAERERDEAKQAATDALTHANNILIKSELKASLIGEGARQDRLARLIKEADLSGVEVTEDEVQNLQPVIKQLKEEIPEWFGSDEQPVGSRPSSRAATGPTNQQIDKEIAERERYRVTSAL